MFGDKKNKIRDSERSLISETVSIEGSINSSGAIDIAGLVKGPVISKEIIIRETGSITGTIEGDRIEIHGHMDGKISGDEVVVGSTGTVKGDIEFGNNLKLKMELILMDTLKRLMDQNLNFQLTFYLAKQKIQKNLKKTNNQRL